MIDPSYTETHEFLVAILGSVPYGIIAIDLEGDITMCNEQAIQFFDLNKKVTDIIETSLADHLEELPEVQEVLVHRLTKGRKRFDLEFIEFQGRFLTIHGRRILNGMIISIEDVTRAKEQERENLNAMLAGQENERQRLAREIHDGIGPVMSTIKLHLDAVKSDLKNQASEKTMNKIQTMSGLVQEVAQDIRGISHALMPGALKDIGLVAAMQNLCQKANQSEKVKVNFYHSGVDDKLDQQVALGVFRITQELLNNAFKYAHSKNINVQLIKHPDTVLLTVEDDGLGFDPSEKERLLLNGIGLRNIQTRTQALGGHFDLDSQPGHGVHAAIEIPVNYQP